MGTASRNISTGPSNTGTALKKSSIHGNGGSRSNRKPSHVSASRNTIYTNGNGNPAYSMIKSNNLHRGPGISGRMQKQFHQYHGQGGGSPPLKGTLRTSMMNIGGTTLGSTQDNLMQLVPVKTNFKNEQSHLTISTKRPYEHQRTQNGSASQERCKVDIFN